MDWLDKLFQAGSKYLDYDLSKLEFQIARDAKANTYQQEQALRAAELRAGSSTGLIIGGVLVAAAVVALFFATRR